MDVRGYKQKRVRIANSQLKNVHGGTFLSGDVRGFKQYRVCVTNSKLKNVQGSTFLGEVLLATLRAPLKTSVFRGALYIIALPIILHLPRSCGFPHTDKACIDTVLLHEFGMGAVLDDTALIHDEYLIGIFDS